MYKTTFRRPGRADKQCVEHRSPEPLYALACELGAVRRIHWSSAHTAEVEYLNGYVETLKDVKTRRYRRS